MEFIRTFFSKILLPAFKRVDVPARIPAAFGKPTHDVIDIAADFDQDNHLSSQFRASRRKIRRRARLGRSIRRPLPIATHTAEGRSILNG